MQRKEREGLAKRRAFYALRGAKSLQQPQARLTTAYLIASTSLLLLLLLLQLLLLLLLLLLLNCSCSCRSIVVAARYCLTVVVVCRSIIAVAAATVAQLRFAAGRLIFHFSAVAKLQLAAQLPSCPTLITLQRHVQILLGLLYLGGKPLRIRPAQKPG
jgi:hypothetical protein